LLNVERFNEPAETLTQTVELCPRHTSAWANRGMALKEAGALADAIDSFEHALEVDGGKTNARWDLAITQLMDGDWRTGQCGYEVRRTIVPADQPLPDHPVRASLPSLPHLIDLPESFWPKDGR